ncbi:MAG: NUDIX domain-containing protein [Alphaproteobacteria bacterium]|nr:NUDIX domain-containing protein [Alphaproteobacteria bacterium]
MRAVVTAGGTSEPIDDVRVVTNFSSGRFGAAIANELVRRGVAVDLLAGRSLASHPEWIDPRVRVVRFGSFAELDAALTDATAPAPDLLFMAAAVSDYSPIPHDGKISSAAEELTIRMRRNPKLLARLRDRCGVGTFLVGFKLLSNVSREELIAVGRRQIRTARANLCVANDLRDLVGDRHPLVLVTPEGGALAREGTKAEVATALVDLVLLRHATTWHRGVRDLGLDEDPHGREGAARLLRIAQQGGMLGGLDGNVSHRSGRGLWVTPRQVDKLGLGADDLVHAVVDPVHRTVTRAAEHKPSIDTPVQDLIYRSFPAVNGLIHVHDALVLPTATTTTPWPCGTVEEGLEIGRTLLGAARDGGWDGAGFALRLVDHGWLIGVHSAERLERDWHEVRDAWRQHLTGVGFDPELATLRPIFERDRIVGLGACFVIDGQPAWSTWLHPRHRGAGQGERVVDQLAAEGRSVVAGDACAVTDWYAERGWRTERRLSGAVVLTPPTLRDDLVPAASVCLIDALGGRVLIGRRKTRPWEGFWAFPGGKLEPGESVLQAALRELEEETGIRPAWTEELGTTEVFVGDRPGYRVTNVRLAIAGAPEPVESEEIAARWVSWDEVGELRPMAAGTRRVLRAATRAMQ